MKVLLIGTGRVDYVSKKTGKEVKGWNLYVTRKPGISESSRVTGEIAESLYVPDTFDISFWLSVLRLRFLLIVSAVLSQLSLVSLKAVGLFPAASFYLNL